jgi:DNA (cytosine-5)-methyltransferase 1
MNYLSVCSGIEAASTAWKNLNWNAVGFSEIEPFPSAVLKYHYPTVTNYGDINGHSEWKLPPVDILVGGTPCQSFSIAGLRKGLEDPRGNIMLTYLRIIESRRPKWTIWENVPGVLSSNGGRDFATFVTALGNMGYGWAYRILDAQWFGVAQRRKRVFVIGYLGEKNLATEVLFKSESVCRNPTKSREKGKEVAGTIAARFGSSRNNPEELTISKALLSRNGSGGFDLESETPVLVYNAPITGTLAAADGPKGVSDQYAHEGKLTVWRAGDNTNAEVLFDLAGTLTCNKGQSGGIINTTFSFDSMSSNSMRSSNPISGCNQVDISKSLDTSRGLDPSCNQGGIAIAVGTDLYNGAITGDIAVPLTNRADGTGTGPTIMQSTAVRRLTPTECERLQGFPDFYTAIPWKKKTADQCPDGPRYKALGNSMAVPVMRWIGERIAEVDSTSK